MTRQRERRRAQAVAKLAAAKADRTGWEPERFAVGDRVIDPDRPKWGVGVVVADISAPCWPGVGQWLTVEWAGRGLVSAFTAKRPLRRA